MAKPKPIRSILEGALKGLEVDFQLKAYSLWGAWGEIVGQTIAAQAQPRAVRNRILFIDVSHPGWIQQLHFLKPTLLEKLNGFLGEPLLQDVRFRLGAIEASSPPASEAPSWREETLNDQTLLKIDKTVATVSDDEVRETLRELLIKGAKVDSRRRGMK
jgi:hypothetical protein